MPNKNQKAKILEKKLTPAEMKKREDVAKAIERDNPNMSMGLKMAIATKTAKRVAEEVDDEGKMARGQLMRMVNQASALAQMMSDDKQLDGWVQSKLTMASDYLDSAHDYLMYNKQDVDDMTEQQDKGSFMSSSPFKPSKGTVTDKSGAKHTSMSVARDLAQKAMQKVIQKKKQGQ